MSECQRCSWSDVWEMPAVEFLNALCYIRDKAEHGRREIERWKRTH